MTPTQRTPAASAALLFEIIEQLPRVYFKLKAFGDEVWGPLGLTTGARGLLTDLVAGTPLTAPQLAAMRPVSRQSVHPILTSLADRGLVARTPNPRNKRSPFFEITKKGETLLQEGRRRERHIVEALQIEISPAKLKQALHVLQKANSLLADALAKPS